MGRNSLNSSRAVPCQPVTRGSVLWHLGGCARFVTQWGRSGLRLDGRVAHSIDGHRAHLRHGRWLSASRLYSATFTANAGDVLSLDVAFLTNDGSPYADYGIVALESVPEPSSLILGVTAALKLGRLAP